MPTGWSRSMWGGVLAKVFLIIAFFSIIQTSCRKILVRNSGPEKAAPILWAPRISVFFLQENLHVHKLPRFRGGGFGFWGGGGSADFIFMGAGIFLNHNNAMMHADTLLASDCRAEFGCACTIGGSQKGGFQKGGFGGCSPGTKTGTRVRSPKPPFWKPPFYLPMTLFGVRKRVVSKRVVSADVPPERKPERGYVRQNHPFTKPPFYLPVTQGVGYHICVTVHMVAGPGVRRDNALATKPKGPHRTENIMP